MFSFLVCILLSCLVTLFIHLIYIFLSYTFCSWYFKDIGDLTGASVIKHTLIICLGLSQGIVVCSAIATEKRQQQKLKHKAIYVNLKISCPNWW